MRLARLRTSLLLAALLGFAGPATAVIIPIDDFELGLGAWTTAGDVSLDGGGVGVAPIQGANQLLLSTNGAGGAVDSAVVESTLGLNSNSIQRIFRQQIRNAGLSTGSGPTEGSGVQITFAAEAGDVLEFEWELLTDTFTAAPPEPDVYTDFAWIILESPGPNSSSAISHANDPNVTFTPLGGAYAHEMGVQTYSVTLANTGSYTLSLGVSDVQDTFLDTGLVFDGFRLQRAPEPDTFALLAVGLLGLAWQGRRLPRRPDTN